ncbi:hypothetical protein NQ315_013846 [Exocentrus adspersus]|uniref:Transforming acidic coiled-coil-containing protein C-terminal domain-containing protein n=1 Tax=Exocentrus adspersus TaxID=1586481 RepID=A0AAV8VHW4_9CUCU|nr:hypothetical protein NQ315_013846 [Exocentrus adspersus]
MDILKIFRMQEPVSKEILSKNNELGKYKEVVQEKDVLLKNNRARIKELEEQVADLEVKNRDMEKQLKLNNMDENEFQKIMKDYDVFIEKVWAERQHLINENENLKMHIENLERCFRDLFEKYEKAKTILQGFKGNEDVLKRELEEYREIIEALNTKYNCLRKHSESKLAEANEELENKDKDNIQEIAKLKVKILQSQATVNELQKRVKCENLDSRPSMFAPLKSNIPKV